MNQPNKCARCGAELHSLAMATAHFAPEADGRSECERIVLSEFAGNQRDGDLADAETLRRLDAEMNDTMSRGSRAILATMRRNALYAELADDPKVADAMRQILGAASIDLRDGSHQDGA